MQPDQIEALAGELVLTIKAALAPVLADVTALKAQNAVWETRWNDLGALRERVAVVEATKAQPVPVVETVDLGPVLERLSASDARADVLQAQVTAMAEFRDRLIAIETKAAQPLPPALMSSDLAPVFERLAVVETKAAQPVLSLPTAGVDDLRDRIVTLETRTAGPSATDMGLVDVRERLRRVEQRVADDAFTKELGTLRERLAVVETRALVPGPAGRDGVNGLNGKDGADGLGFTDLGVEFDGDRTMALRFDREGVPSKVFPIVLPYQKQQGVYQDGKSYVLGDLVTWGGSQWACNESTTTKPGDGSKAWTLVVKRGRDGRDGVDAPGALPVVSVGRR